MYSDMADEKSKSSIKEQINENLKRVYEEALQEEVPDRFKDLLAQLKAKEGGK
ncbi:NepR family anti-sigma factor [uncultured Thioclava sp.]|uniref:NepR family anti-sigma factor n=1 Tax=Thioclava arctica TaxID=3238301 RepID=A0ABV3TI62_9RHOB|nr:NepR family anti-sigma factor [uncultured Thioclava sp.]